MVMIRTPLSALRGCHGANFGSRNCKRQDIHVVRISVARGRTLTSRSEGWAAIPKNVGNALPSPGTAVPL